MIQTDKLSRKIFNAINSNAHVIRFIDNNIPNVCNVCRLIVADSDSVVIRFIDKSWWTMLYVNVNGGWITCLQSVVSDTTTLQWSSVVPEDHTHITVIHVIDDWHKLDSSPTYLSMLQCSHHGIFANCLKNIWSNVLVNFLFYFSRISWPKHKKIPQVVYPYKINGNNVNYQTHAHTCLIFSLVDIISLVYFFLWVFECLYYRYDSEIKISTISNVHSCIISVILLSNSDQTKRHILFSLWLLPYFQ